MPPWGEHALQFRRPVKEVRTCGTMTDELLALVDWVVTAGCTHVARERTGSFCKPLYTLLEGMLEVQVVNAAHIKAVPGRKTAVRNCEWSADLLRHDTGHECMRWPAGAS